MSVAGKSANPSEAAIPVRAVQPVALYDPSTGLPSAGGGGGGGAVTIADGADVTQGAVADAAYVSGSGTVVSVLKAIFARFGIGAASVQVQGPSASGVTAVGNPVAAGGVFVSALPTLTTGQRNELMVTADGSLRIAVSSGANTAAVGTPADGQSSSNSLSVRGNLSNWNGTTYDRTRGDTFGTWVNPGILPTGTNRSGTATTTSGGLNVAASATRRQLNGQNISAVVIGFNEFGGTAAIGTAGTYTVQPGAGFSISTQNLVNFIAASGTAAVTMTES